MRRERIAQWPASMEVASVEIVGRSRKSSWFSKVTCLLEGEIHHRGSRHNMQVRPPHATAKPPRRASQSTSATDRGNATTATRTIRTIVLEQGFEGARLNTGTMSDLQILATTILANFTTARIPRCESLWTCSIPDPSPKRLHRLRSRALTRETFIMNCHRRHLQHRLLERGHRAFFDRIEGGGPDGWRLHFFCHDTEAVGVLYDVGVGVCGPGSAVNFDAEQFIMYRLCQLERTDRLHSPDGWWDWNS